MKIFKMNECDWIAAETLDDAKKCLADHVNCGIQDSDFEEEFLDDPHQVHDSYLDKLLYIDEDTPDEEITFRQQLDKMIADAEKFPAFFATTEY